MERAYILIDNKTYEIELGLLVMKMFGKKLNIESVRLGFRIQSTFSLRLFPVLSGEKLQPLESQRL